MDAGAERNYVVNTIKLKNQTFDGKHARIGYRPITTWRHPVFLMITEPRAHEHIETPCVFPLMPFLIVCGYCANLITDEKKEAINGAN